MQTLASPNRVTWEYFFSLRQLADNAKDAPSRELCRQVSALAIIMSVTVVEVFLNIWFRIRVEEKHGAPERAQFLKNLSPPFLSLDRKLKLWPKRYLGRELNLTSGPVAAFLKLKNTRNEIIHFTSTHESFRHEALTIQGLADFTKYDSLNYDDAQHAVEVAEHFVAELFCLAGAQPETISHLLHVWTGKVAV